MIGRLVDKWSDTLAIYNRVMQRNARWIEIYKKRGGSAEEFLIADFGTAKPNGLDIDRSPECDITIKKDWRTKFWGLCQCR